MNICITGATGFIGKALALRLASEGHTIHALYRSEQKIHDLKHPGIRLFKAHLQDSDSLARAIDNCQQVYHIAAYARAWAKEPETFYQLNVHGTRNVLDLSLQLGVNKLLYASTAGVLRSSGEEPVSEESPDPKQFFTHYDRSKHQAEKMVREYVGKGLQAVIVNPTRVFGPGPLEGPNGTTMLIDRYTRGKWHLKPGRGTKTGNYVYIDDVINGMIAAMQSGKSGERYILSGENISFNDLIRCVDQVTGKKHFLIAVPVPLMLAVARFMVLLARIYRSEPLIAPDFVRKYNQDWMVSHEKATTELGYQPLSINAGIEKTIAWITQTDITS